MADDEEWPDYSSCFITRQESSLDSDKEDEHEEVVCGDIQSDISDVERLGYVREVLKRSLRTDQSTSPDPEPCPYGNPSVSEIKGPFEHRIWLKLLAKLNSIRQAKWTDSHLEEHYNECLHVSRNTNPQESSQITVYNFDKNWFNFHAMKTYSSSLNNGTVSGERNDNTPKNITDLDNVRLKKNDMESRDKLTLLDISAGELRNDVSPKCDCTFEDLDPELEWSDNDVKNESASSNLSTMSGFDESEAAADLARLSYEEIIQLRKELEAYTKQYSDILVIELENRDAYIREKELKNNFISSFLAVQGKIREATITTNKKKFSLQSSPLSTSPFLTTTIPYEIQNGGPVPDILEKLIEIMEAMRTNSPNVPSLLTNYILKVLCK